MNSTESSAEFVMKNEEWYTVSFPDPQLASEGEICDQTEQPHSLWKVMRKEGRGNSPRFDRDDDVDVSIR